jgi:hypothetical protein
MNWGWWGFKKNLDHENLLTTEDTEGIEEIRVPLQWAIHD